MITKTAGDMSTIWKRLFKTDSRFTKEFRRAGGFSGTDINPTYRMAVMTEEFGPCGLGWGWNIEDRWSEQFGDRCYAFVQCSIWYKLDYGSEEVICTTGSQIGGTEYGRTPDEAYKMAVTDAIGKCMTSLGLSADIYMQQYDSKYQREDVYTGQKEYDINWATELLSSAAHVEALEKAKNAVRDSRPPKKYHDKLLGVIHAKELEFAELQATAEGNGG